MFHLKSTTYAFILFLFDYFLPVSRHSGEVQINQRYCIRISPTDQLLSTNASRKSHHKGIPHWSAYNCVFIVFNCFEQRHESDMYVYMVVERFEELALGAWLFRHSGMILRRSLPLSINHRNRENARFDKKTNAVSRPAEDPLAVLKLSINH